MRWGHDEGGNDRHKPILPYCQTKKNLISNHGLDSRRWERDETCFLWVKAGLHLRTVMMTDEGNQESFLFMFRFPSWTGKVPGWRFNRKNRLCPSLCPNSPCKSSIKKCPKFQFIQVSFSKRITGTNSGTDLLLLNCHPGLGTAAVLPSTNTELD